jgi:hypothetical protein
MKAKYLFKRGLVSLCVLLTSCGASMSENITEFDWHATESAPNHYPMKIVRGTFLYKGQDHGLYIPSGGTLRGGWGHMNSMHVTGPDKKPLPDRVDVIFFSLTEKQFYRGQFDLPYEEILAMFRQSHIEDPERPYYNGIMIGVAPGGAVSVWLKGRRVTEVFFGQAEKVDISPSSGLGLNFDSKEESDTYIEDILTDVLKPDELASLKKDGVPFGAWARYRNLYKWSPAYKDGKFTSDKTMPVQYLNGEKDWLPTIFHAMDAKTPRVLPRKLKFSVTFGNRSILFDIDFDEQELMAAVEKLVPSGDNIRIEFDPQLPRTNTKVRVYNDEEVIELNKTVTKE